MSKEQGPCEAWVRLAASNLGCRHTGIKTCHALHGGSIMSKEQGPCVAWVRLAANNIGCRHPGIGQATYSSEATL